MYSRLTLRTCAHMHTRAHTVPAACILKRTEEYISTCYLQRKNVGLTDYFSLILWAFVYLLLFCKERIWVIRPKKANNSYI